jgi:predicted molibdopterin-dependent oxidoreductase YjgC
LFRQYRFNDRFPRSNSSKAKDEQELEEHNCKLCFGSSETDKHGEEVSGTICFVILGAVLSITLSEELPDKRFVEELVNEVRDWKHELVDGIIKSFIIGESEKKDELFGIREIIGDTEI